jgi:ABC-type uncharacterized transport system fused permease/ATPase subunit
MSAHRFLTPARVSAAGAVVAISLYWYSSQKATKKRSRCAAHWSKPMWLVSGVAVHVSMPSFVTCRKSTSRASEIVSKAEVSRFLSDILSKMYRIGGTKLLGVAVLTIVRTALLNYQGRVQGYLFEAAFLKHVPRFMRLLLENVALCVASSSVETTTRYLLDCLAIQWRGHMTERLHRKYFSNMVRLNHLSPQLVKYFTGIQCPAHRCPR